MSVVGRILVFYSNLQVWPHFDSVVLYRLIAFFFFQHFLPVRGGLGQFSAQLASIESGHSVRRTGLHDHLRLHGGGQLLSTGGHHQGSVRVPLRTR